MVLSDRPVRIGQSQYFARANLSGVEVREGRCTIGVTRQLWIRESFMDNAMEEGRPQPSSFYCLVVFTGQ
jgi:hypothetical protein